MRKMSFPVGALVLVDGRYKVRVKQSYPDGSTSYMFPHYRVDYVGGDKNVAVDERRIGVKGYATMKPISDYSITDHGVEHSQYFQGAGVAGTEWEACYTGIGCSLAEALGDVVEQLAMSEEYDAATLPDGWDEGMLKLTDDKVGRIIRDNCDCDDCQVDGRVRECSGVCECFEQSELHCFVTIFVK